MTMPTCFLRHAVGSLAPAVVSLDFTGLAVCAANVQPVHSAAVYPNRQPAARYRLDAQDHGPVLRHGGGPGRCDERGRNGQEESASASYGVTFFGGKSWRAFYLGTPNTRPVPDCIPTFPYLRLKARATGPEGRWVKQPDVIPFRTKPGMSTQRTPYGAGRGARRAPARAAI